MKNALLLLAAWTAACLAGCGGAKPAMTPSSETPAALSSLALLNSPANDITDAAAAGYCRQTGGEVILRRPVYGSNSSQLLFLAGKRSFCQYTKKKDGSRIHILLGTLYTTKPTLAALAYILKPPPTSSCHGNPASCYCTYLGGSDQFGQAGGAGGGWYNKKAIDQVLEACIFPDMSSIDSWGLAYHSQGIIRGIDLTKVMRYKYPGTNGHPFKS